MSRTAFEAWFSDDGKYPRACERSREGGYVLAHAADAWQAAQADAYERAAKVCRKIADNPEYGDLFADGAVECEEAIRALAKEAK